MSDAAGLLKRARDLFQQGQPEQAEEIVGRLLRDNPRDATALNFRAYLLYCKGSFDDAMAAYRRLAELEPGTPGHLENLGLICFKSERYLEAQNAFERLLELQPGEARTLRNLGYCHERQQSLEKALECFVRAGDEQRSAAIRERLSQGAFGGGREMPPAAGGQGRRDAASEPDVDAWLAGLCLPLPGEGPEIVRAGAGELMVKVREKIFINPAFCIGHRGVVVFAPASREAEKAASKFGDRHGVLARAEGNGELVLSGRAAGLHALSLGGGRLSVNWGSLVLCGTGIDVSFEHAGLVKESFLAVELAGAGPVVLAVRGAAVVLPVLDDHPAFVRPESAVAWTGEIRYEAEAVPELKRLVGKAESLRYRFEGRGHLVLQSC